MLVGFARVSSAGQSLDVQLEALNAVGVYKGRRPSIDHDQIRSLHQDGLGATAIANRLKIGRASVYRALAEDGET